MPVNRSETAHIPKKSYPALSPLVLTSYFKSVPEEVRSGLVEGLTKILNNQATDERLNYDVIEKNLGGYTPLLPWGYQGDASEYGGWYTVHLTEADAEAGNTPYLMFGNPGEGSDAVGYGGRNTAGDGYFEIHSDDGGFILYGAIDDGASTNYAEIRVNTSSHLSQLGLVGGAGTTYAEVRALTGQASVSLASQDGSSPTAITATVDTTNDRASLSILGGGGQGWIELDESATVPARPSANRVRLYAIDNAGKTEFLARFNSGADQQIAIQP